MSTWKCFRSDRCHARFVFQPLIHKLSQWAGWDTREKGFGQFDQPRPPVKPRQDRSLPPTLKIESQVVEWLDQHAHETHLHLRPGLESRGLPRPAEIKLICRPPASSGREFSSALQAAARPARSPSKQKMIEGAQAKSLCRCLSVVAVPSVATALSTPC